MRCFLRGADSDRKRFGGLEPEAVQAERAANREERLPTDYTPQGNDRTDRLSRRFGGVGELTR